MINIIVKNKTIQIAKKKHLLTYWFDKTYDAKGLNIKMLMYNNAKWKVAANAAQPIDYEHIKINELKLKYCRWIFLRFIYYFRERESMCMQAPVWEGAEVENLQADFQQSPIWGWSHNPWA